MGDDEQGQRAALVALGVDADSIYIDHGLTGTDRPRPALAAALSALSARDTLVGTTLERLARSVTDLSEIATDLAQRDVLLMFAGTARDPKDPIGATVFDMLSQTFSKFETGLIHLRTMEGNARRKPPASPAAPHSSTQSSKQISSTCTLSVSIPLRSWQKCSISVNPVSTSTSHARRTYARNPTPALLLN